MYNSQYWLALYPHVFIFTQKKRVLLYNSYTGSFTYCSSSKITDELNNPDNNYVIPIYPRHLRNKVINTLIKRLEHAEIGKLVIATKENKRPLSVFPRLVIDNFGYNPDERSYKSFSELTEFTLFITGNCSKECPNCDIFFKQQLWCHKNDYEIPSDKLMKFLSFLPLSGILRINILGGDIFSYAKLGLLTTYLNQFNIVKNYFVNILHLLDNIDKLELLFYQKNYLKVLISPPYDKFLFTKVIESRIINRMPITFIITVSSVEEYEYAVDITGKQGIDAKIIPIYTGVNIDFFEDYVFMDIHDIQNNVVSMREIFAHKYINTNYFGKLILFSSGEIYSNINDAPVGTMDDSIYKIVNSQYRKDSSWRKIRNNQVCSECIYQWLCPSPSNYNFILNRFDLCNIKNGKAVCKK